MYKFLKNILNNVNIRMKTYNQLYNQILNEYQINSSSSQSKNPVNPVIGKLIDYLEKKIGVNMDPRELEDILKDDNNQDDNNQDEETKNNNNNNVDQQNPVQNPVQNTQNNIVKSNVVSNIPPNNFTSVQNKNTQKKI